MNTLPAVNNTLEQKGHLHLLAIILGLVLLAAARTVAREKRLFLVALVFGIPALISQVAVLGVENSTLDAVRFFYRAGRPGQHS